jgi:hypothetical protein
MILAGGENGFVPDADALAMWKSHQTAWDYHHRMTQNRYEKWLKEKFVPNFVAGNRYCGTSQRKNE